MRFVECKLLEEGMVLARDILGVKNSRMLMRGVALTKDYIAFIQNNGYLGAYISDELSEGVEIESAISDKLFCASMLAVENADIGSLIRSATEIADEMYYNPSTTVDLFDLRSYDDYTFHHSVNVAVYATMVGKQMNLSKQKLDLLCQTALCHDLGKMRIPLEVLNKPGRLTDEEYDLMKSHPKLAYEILSEADNISALVKQGVYLHHENVNGSGYPMGKMGDEIPLFARIIHAVDVYDALTSRRPYKEPYSSVEALEYLHEGVGVLFDKNVVDIIDKTIPAYPPGIQVVLSDGNWALVIAHTTEALRPKVKLIDTGKVVDLSTDEAYKDVTIINASTMEQNYAKSIERLNESRQAVRDLTPTIVIVDSESVSRKQIQSSIQGDYICVPMESGLQLLNYLEEHSAPDLIIMAVDMPLYNGLQTAMKIRENGKQQIPIIFTAEKNDIDTVLACKMAGGIDYILKPAKPIYINERVEIALKNTRE